MKRKIRLALAAILVLLTGVAKAQKTAPLHYLVLNANNSDTAARVAALLQGYGKGKHYELKGGIWNTQAEGELNNLYDAMFAQPQSVGIIYYSSAQYNEAALLAIQTSLIKKSIEYTEKDEILQLKLTDFFMKYANAMLNAENNDALTTIEDMKELSFEIPNVIVILEDATTTLDKIKTSGDKQLIYFYAFSNKIVYSKRNSGPPANGTALAAYLHAHKDAFTITGLLNYMVSPSQPNWYFMGSLQKVPPEHFQNLSHLDSLHYHVQVMKK